MRLCLVSLGCSVSLSLVALGCGSPLAVPPGDAGAAPDAYVAAVDDARVDRDASAAPLDAFLPPDTGTPLGGCFENSLTLWTSSAGPGDRAHGVVRYAVGYEHGWLVGVGGLHDPDQLVMTDLEGHVRSVTDVELYGQSARAFTIGRSLYLFAGNSVLRLEVDETGVTQTYAGEYVGGLTERSEHMLDVEPLRGASGFRALSLHYDTTASEWVVRLSELRPDDRAASGVRQITGRVTLPADLAIGDAQYYLAGEHVRVLSGGPNWRVLDLQLGLGSLGTDPTIPSRTWSDQVWTDGPALVLDLAGEGDLAVTARVDPITSAYGAQIENVPPATALILPLGSGLDLGFGRLGTAILEVDGRIAIASTGALGLYERGGMALRSVALSAAPSTPMGVARRLGGVATAFVQADSGDARVALRCMALP